MCISIWYLFCLSQRINRDKLNSLYLISLPYSNSFAKKDEGIKSSITWHEWYGLWNIGFQLLDKGGHFYWMSKWWKGIKLLSPFTLCLRLVYMALSSLYFSDKGEQDKCKSRQCFTVCSLSCFFCFFDFGLQSQQSSSSTAMYI